MDVGPHPNRKPIATFPTSWVRSRLASYDDQAVEIVTDTLWKLIDSDARYADAIDRKATTLLGYGAGLLTVAIPWLISRKLFVCTADMVGYGLALLAALVAIALSFSAFRGRGGWPSFTDETLFPKPGAYGGFDREATIRFWGLALHGLYKRQQVVCRRKGAILIWAQRALTVSIVLIAIIVTHVLAADPSPGVEAISLGAHSRSELSRLLASSYVGSSSVPMPSSLSLPPLPPSFPPEVPSSCGGQLLAVRYVLIGFPLLSRGSTSTILTVSPPYLRREFPNLGPPFLAQRLRPRRSALQAAEPTQQLSGRILLSRLGRHLPAGDLHHAVGEFIHVGRHLGPTRRHLGHT